MLKRIRSLALLALGMMGMLLAPGLVQQAAAATVPCSGDIGGGRYNCTFWTTTPLEGPSDGTIREGVNWVYCQEQGKTVSVQGWNNNWWAWTLRDRGTGTYGDGYGWVNAVYGKGGNDYEGFQNVPNCNGGHGLPPQAAPAPSGGSAGQEVLRPAPSTGGQAGSGVTLRSQTQQTTQTTSPSSSSNSNNNPSQSTAKSLPQVAFTGACNTPGCPNLQVNKGLTAPPSITATAACLGEGLGGFVKTKDGQKHFVCPEHYRVALNLIKNDL